LENTPDVEAIAGDADGNTARERIITMKLAKSGFPVWFIDRLTDPIKLAIPYKQLKQLL
jgi:hypothetical protein